MSAAGTLLGLAFGDAVAWPAAFQRSRLMPAWTRRKARDLTAFGDEHGVTDPVVPFGLNVTPTPLVAGPGDVTDWVADTWRGAADGLPVSQLWARRLDHRQALAGRISAMTALDSLARDGHATGAHNPHGHDDLAALRALGFAAALGGDAGAAIAEDAALTNHGDGVASARWLGDLVGHGLVSGGLDVWGEPGAWGADPHGRLSLQHTEFSALVRSAPDPWSLALAVAPLLDAVYSYADLAGDTVPAALALVAWTVDHPDHPAATLPGVVGASLALVRQGGSVPALVGALMGSALGPGAVPDGWRSALRPTGCSIPWAADITLPPSTQEQVPEEPTTKGSR
ncbi:hypothetical protein [Mariniluteicoccus flavus]